jgi:hypothetical protein
MDFAAAVHVLRVTVNAGGSTGASGFDTNLAPSMTIGTGFVGRSSLGENLEPKHLVNWTRVAYNADPAVPMPSFAGLSPWTHPSGHVPPYPRASNAEEGPAGGRPTESAAGHRAGPAGRQDPRASLDADRLREHIRRVIVEELAAIVKD